MLLFMRMQEHRQYHLNAYNEFATEVSKAAQWQLIKEQHSDEGGRA